MTLDVDFLINFLKKYTDKKTVGEMGEQESAAAPSSGGSSVPKWADTYPITRGKANPLPKSGQKWTTGLTRGSGNQIW